MPWRRRRKKIATLRIHADAAGLLLLFLPGSKKDLVCYVPPGNRYPSTGRVAGPENQWDSDRDHKRDSEFCKRINKQTGFSVFSYRYDVGSAPRKGEKVYVPHNWIRNVYAFARENKYERLYLVGFSGGGMVASSQLVYYHDDPIVKSLVVISGDVAAGPDKPHRNAAFFADQIRARTLLIYGDKDGDAVRGARVWKQQNPLADLKPHSGGHDFYDQFDLVTQEVVDFLMQPAVAVRRLTGRAGKRRKGRSKKGVRF